jgi:hypothetical protein
MDMMDSMKTVVFEESEDEFEETLSTFGANSNNNMMEDTTDSASSEQWPLLDTTSAPSKQQHQRDAFPDTPTKKSILERLGSNISQDSAVNTTKSRLKAVSHESSGGGGGSGGVDLLHLDAPVRTF